ncbi:MAG: hypothetical protein RMK00_09300, partial [Bacteroidota bacterium]|nr:hypothetical protein [Bacteroidota bacterium]
GKRVARQRDAHLRLHKGTALAVATAALVGATTNTNNTTNTTPHMPPPKAINTAPESVLRPWEAEKYHQLKAKIEQVGYEGLTRVEKREWNLVNRLYTSITYSMQVGDGRARVMAAYNMQTNPVAQLSAALPPELRKELRDVVEKLANKVQRTQISTYTTDDGDTYYL